MEIAETCKDIARRICPLTIVNITLEMLRNLRGKEQWLYLWLKA